MHFLGFPTLILWLALAPGPAARADGGNHCEIKEDNEKCKDVKGDKPGMQKVKAACDELMHAQDQARDTAKKSCDNEKVTTEQNAGCMIAASNQSDLDKCNMVGKRDLADVANKSAADKNKARKKIRDARHKLDEAITAAMNDSSITDEDFASLQKASEASDASNDVESDVARSAADDASNGAAAGSQSDTSGDRSSSLDSYSGNAPVDGSGQGANAETMDASGAPVASNSPATTAEDGGSTQSISSPLAQGSDATPAATTAAAPAATTPAAATPSAAAATNATTAPAQAAAPAPAQFNPLQEQGVNMAPSATSAAANLFGGGQAVTGGSQLGLKLDPGPARMTDQLREDLRARMDRAAKTRVADESTREGPRDFSSGAATSWFGARANRAPASVEAASPDEREAEPAPGSPQFSSSLVGQRFSLLGSDTDAAVKRLVGQLDSAKAMAVTGGIGESNGPSLFARSHAILESALRRGFVRGVAAR